MNTRALIFLALLAALPAHGVDKLLMVNPSNPGVYKASGIVVTSNTIPYSALSGTPASSTMWATNVYMATNRWCGAVAWQTLVSVTPARTSGVCFVSAKGTLAELNGSTALASWLRLLRVDGAQTNVVTVSGATTPYVNSGCTPAVFSAEALTNTTTFVLEGITHSSDAGDAWLGTNSTVNGVSNINNATGINIVGF